VLWRFRFLVAGGLVLACALAFFSFASISFAGGSPKLTYRQTESWKATDLLFVTQKGFPYGYTVLPSTQAPSGSTGTIQPSSSKFGSPGWFTSLAVLYSPLVQGDAFRSILRHATNIKGVVSAQAVVDAHNLPQPFIDLSAYATTNADAVRLSNAAAGAFQHFIVAQQIANRIPPARRVVLQVVSNATPHSTILFSGRKKTTPIVIFLTVLLATIGLAFVLENLRPRVRPLAADEEEQQPVAARRPA
jgi:hypothetical protein